MTTNSAEERGGLHSTAGLGAARDLRLIEDARELADALSDLVRVIQFRDRDRACCYDVSAAQCYALKGLVQAGPLTVNELAAHLYSDKSTASRSADALAGKGYATRARDGQDGRVVRVVATPAGEALCAAIEAGEARDYADLLADFEPDVRSQLTRLVSGLARCFASSVETTGGSCCVVK